MSVATFRAERMNVIVKAHSLTQSFCDTLKHIYLYAIWLLLLLQPSMFYVFAFDFIIGNGAAVVVIAVVVFTAYNAYINCSPMMMIHVRYTQP